MSNSARISFASLGRAVIRARWWVIGFWILFAALVNIGFPQLETVVRDQSAPAYPADSPTFTVLDQMVKAFDEQGSQTTVIVVVEKKSGLTEVDEQVLRSLIASLKADREHVLRVQEFLDEPETKKSFTSADNELWQLPIGISGEIGTPKALESVESVQRIAADRTAGSGLDVRVTGPPATAADGAIATESSLGKITAATGLLITLILLVIYRSIITALLPLLMIGVSVLCARGVAAALGTAGFGVNLFAVALMTVILTGAGTDYAVFIISRYHEFIRGGLPSDQAIALAAGAIGKIIAASAATVALACASLTFTKLAFFAAGGPACALGITIAFLASVTLLPAILSVAAGYGRALPKQDRVARTWHKVGVIVVRRPIAVLVTSLVVLIGFAACAPFIKFNYDDRVGMPKDTQSNVGYSMLDAHFPKDFVLPQYLVISSASNMRTAEGLADLEQMAARVAQVPGVTTVRGITRPNGTPLSEASVSGQAGEVGSRLANAADEIGSKAAEFAPILTDVHKMLGSITALRSNADVMLKTAADANKLLVSAGGIDGLAAQLTSVRNVSTQLNSIRDELAQFSGVAQQAANVAASVQPAIDLLNTSSVCGADPQCEQLRVQLRSLLGVGDGSLSAHIDWIRDTLANTDPKAIDALLGQADRTLHSAKNAILQMGGDPNDLSGFMANAINQIDTMADKAESLGSRMSEVSPAVDKLQSALQNAADYLRELGGRATRPSMSGFYIPAIVLNSIDFQTAASMFVSKDGHTARYLISSEYGAFGAKAIELADTVRATAAAALPNTSLEGSSVGLAGATALSADLKTYVNADFYHILITTLIIVLAVLVLLLRSVLAPLYLLVSVVLSYVSALGIGVVVFQFILKQELSWMAPTMAFIILVAVGADYNMLLISRLRDECRGRSIRVGVIRTVSSTGSVITSAGVIFAASMFGLMAGQLQSLTQIGFIMGTGLLLDTFIVRTLTVPALASILGRANWWPSK